MLHMVIMVLLSHSSIGTMGQIPDPRDVALRASDMVMRAMNDPEYFNFGTWSYQGAGIVRGLWEIQQVYVDFPIENFLHDHLNYFQTEPSEYGYQLLNNITISNSNVTALTDGISLFPICYADRLKYAKYLDAFNPLEDLYIVTESVKQHIYAYPYHLEDGTISEIVYIEGEPLDYRAKYLWVDDMFMGTALTSALSQLTGDPIHVLESAKQVIQLASYLVVEEEMDGLFHHGFDDNTGEPSCCKWGRGNGWSILGKMDTLESLEDLGLQNESQYTNILTLFRNHCEALINAQSSEGGWHNILTNSDTFVETSATGMYLAALIKGVERGWLDRLEYDDAIQRAWRVVAAAVQSDGSVSGILEGTGIMTEEEGYDRPTEYNTAGSGLVGVLRGIAAAGRYFQV